jgi:hypothetical protein
VWNVTASLTATRGDGCAKEAVQSLMDASEGYSLSVIQTGDRSTVSLTSASGGFACSFIGVAGDSSGFTSKGVPGYYSCSPDLSLKSFRCSNGRQVSLMTFGQDITGTISGDAITGTWEVFWIDWTNDEASLETTAQFTGRRQ